MKQARTPDPISEQAMRAAGVPAPVTDERETPEQRIRFLELQLETMRAKLECSQRIATDYGKAAHALAAILRNSPTPGRGIY